MPLCALPLWLQDALSAVGLVLLTAALIGTKELVLSTGYSRRFISAITSNLENNRLWTGDEYDSSAWLLADGRIDQDRFWEHIEIACGSLWMPEAISDDSADTCAIYSSEASHKPPSQNSN
jgi:hypothetical protein